MSQKSAERISIFVNGDVRNQETQIEIDQNGDKDMAEFLLELTWKIKPWFGVVQFLKETPSGIPVENYSELQQGGKYVVFGSKEAEKPGMGEEAKPKIKRMDSFLIYLMMNGCVDKPPARLVTRPRDTNRWTDLLRNVAVRLNIPHGDLQELRGLKGEKIKAGKDLKNGECYIAVAVGQTFKQMDYVSACVRFLPDKFLNLDRQKGNLSEIDEERIRNYVAHSESYWDLDEFDASRFAIARTNRMNGVTSFRYLPNRKYIDGCSAQVLPLENAIEIYKRRNYQEYLETCYFGESPRGNGKPEESTKSDKSKTGEDSSVGNKVGVRKSTSGMETDEVRSRRASSKQQQSEESIVFGMNVPPNSLDSNSDF